MVFLVFFTSVGGIALLAQPSTETCAELYTSEIWNACATKVPTCQKCVCTEMRLCYTLRQ